MIINKCWKIWLVNVVGLMMLFFYPNSALVLSSTADPEEVTINIIHTNDIHGNFESKWNNGILEVIGLDMVRGVKDKIPNSLLIDAGDFAQGGFFFALDQNSVVELFNQTSYDLSVPGNHEFDATVGQVVENAKHINCPVLSANIVNEKGVPIFSGINGNNGENYVINRNGKRIGFFGLTTTETPLIIPPDNLSDTKFKDEIEEAKNQVSKLKKQNVDMIVAVTHMGVGASTNYTTEKLAQEVSGIDLIIDGHSHTKMMKKVNNTVIQQTGAQSTNIGMVEVKFGKNGISGINAYTMNAEEVGKNFTSNQDVLKKYNECLDNLRPTVEKVVGYVEIPLYGGAINNQNVARSFETNLGDIFCDSMIDYAQNNIEGHEGIPKIAFINGGGLRSTIPQGFVSYGDVMKATQYGNRISFQIITPKILYQVLERGVGKIKYPNGKDECFSGAFGGFPQVSGFKFDFDISKEPYNYKTNQGGNRVSSVSLVDSNGKPYKSISRDDNDTKMMLVSNNSMLHEFPAIAKIEKIKVGDILTDILSNYIYKLSVKNGSVKYDMNSKRVNLINNKQFKNFNSTVVVRDSSGVLSEVDVDVYVDGKLFKKIKTDKEGKIYIKDLETGAHILDIEYGNLGGKILVSNLCDLRNSQITLSDKSISDFHSVENIIGQIKHDMSEDDRDLIKFARISYDMLCDDAKKNVINYCKLERAEKEILGDKSKFIRENKEILIFSCIFVSSVAILSVMLIIRKRNHNKKGAL